MAADSVQRSSDSPRWAEAERLACGVRPRRGMACRVPTDGAGGCWDMSRTAAPGAMRGDMLAPTVIPVLLRRVV
jgi:hypothetical protein